MTSFKVSDMTCGHCAGTVEKAVKSVDAGASVKVDLGSKRVDIDSAAPAARFAEAIRNAGYTPQPQA
jgi:copper chaperone